MISAVITAREKKKKDETNISPPPQKKNKTKTSLLNFSHLLKSLRAYTDKLLKINLK